MKRDADVVTGRQKLSTDLLVAHLLERLMKEQIINQETYIKAKREVSKDVRK